MYVSRPSVFQLAANAGQSGIVAAASRAVRIAAAGTKAYPSRAIAVAQPEGTTARCRIVTLPLPSPCAIATLYTPAICRSARSNASTGCPPWIRWRSLKITAGTAWMPWLV